MTVGSVQRRGAEKERDSESKCVRVTHIPCAPRLGESGRDLGGGGTPFGGDPVWPTWLGAPVWEPVWG